MNVPKLRFSEFSDEYSNLYLSDITTLIKDGTHGTHKNYEGGIPLLSAKDIYNNKINIPKDCRRISLEDYNKIYKNYSLIQNDILLTIVGSIGRTALYNNEKISFQRSVATIRINQQNSPKYIRQYIESSIINTQLNNMMNTSAQGGVYLSSLSKLNFNLPNLSEQKKIAHMLELLDKKINLQNKKIEAIKLFKSYTKSEIFKNGNHVCKLGVILNKWNKKNKDGAINYVESISNKAGFIPQSEQFEDRNVASKNLRNYYVIKKGVFGYNPSRLNVGSLALKENDFISVVSPLYECFTTTQNNTYLFEWFNSNNFKKETFSKFEGGVRNTLNFNNLCDIPINLPDIETQNQYAKYFNKINFKISLEEQKLSELVKFKKGLLQDMFI